MDVNIASRVAKSMDWSDFPGLGYGSTTHQFLSLNNFFHFSVLVSLSIYIGNNGIKLIRCEY